MIEDILHDESGMGVVEVILIIVVLTGLVMLFQKGITPVVSKILETISKNVSQIK